MLLAGLLLCVSPALAADRLSHRQAWREVHSIARWIVQSGYAKRAHTSCPRRLSRSRWRCYMRLSGGHFVDQHGRETSRYRERVDIFRRHGELWVIDPIYCDGTRKPCRS